MNTLARNSTSRWRNLSRRRRESHGGLRPSFSYRRERARQRQVFLKTYKLGSADRLAADESNSRGLCNKKAVVKAKAMVISVLSFMRIGSLRSCNCQSAIRASAPQPLKSHCL
ncbi:hypothetical protein BT93_A1573 [Corymbia citriodora subsp. variegata]|nr:hypothetical protein BT93_A1573 [Corymbia citriodora subsp. variegata]